MLAVVSIAEIGALAHRRTPGIAARAAAIECGADLRRPRLRHQRRGAEDARGCECDRAGRSDCVVLLPRGGRGGSKQKYSGRGGLSTRPGFMSPPA